MEAPFDDAEGMYGWLANLARRELDCTIEDRGAKGSGKSAGQFWTILKILTTYGTEVTPDVAKLVVQYLCYNRPQYAKVYTLIREERKTDNERPMFIWGDDADQLFDRRGHASLTNRAMLGLFRKARDQLRAIQFLGTQDDFLERPLLEGGQYIRRIYVGQGEAEVYWPVFNRKREGDPRWEYVFTQAFPDPYKAFPQTWRNVYQAARRQLTEVSMEDLLDVLDPKPISEENAPTIRAAVITEHQADVTASGVEVMRRLKAKGIEATYNYVNLIIRQYRLGKSVSREPTSVSGSPVPRTTPSISSGA